VQNKIISGKVELQSDRFEMKHGTCFLVKFFYVSPIFTIFSNLISLLWGTNQEPWIQKVNFGFLLKNPSISMVSSETRFSLALHRLLILYFMLSGENMCGGSRLRWFLFSYTLRNSNDRKAL
jgi:hypothetical protein